MYSQKVSPGFEDQDFSVLDVDTATKLLGLEMTKRIKFLIKGGDGAKSAL